MKSPNFLNPRLFLPRLHPSGFEISSKSILTLNGSAIATSFDCSAARQLRLTNRQSKLPVEQPLINTSTFSSLLLHQKDEIEELEASLEALAEELDKNILKGQVLEIQVPPFEEQIDSNVVVAYAMDLLDLVQKVLNACVRQKNLEGAFWVLQQLKEQGQLPNTITYGLIMEVMLPCEKYNLVHEFFKKMQKSFIPNSLTYKVVVNIVWKEG
ncbi:unnamed protein product [Lactuca saligna]|uniref:Pentatricopeptide repeat-containing protein n=1 Tax=Lactuca saligna TaxID=75948 RepID=A0AA35VFC2_LACSI|nr:unnamed protein product [Lactuca saligna]